VEKLLGAALADARRIEHERAPWGAAFAALIRAGAAARLGNGPEAAALFASAETSLLAADMHLFAAAARRRRGLLEGESGAAKVLAADEMMKSISIRNPARMTALLAP
jgi:hypothetical protein